MKRYINKRTSVIIIAFLFSIVIYYELFKTFYQQDEWQGIGHMLALGIRYVSYGIYPVNMLFGEGRPLGALLNYILFRVFPYNMIFLSLYAVILHAINALLVFHLAGSIFRKKSISWIAMVLFLTNSVGNQSVIWAGTSAPTLTATAFITGGTLLFVQYLRKKDSKLLYLSYLLLIISFYFKEMGLIILVLMLSIDLLVNWRHGTIRQKFFHIVVPLLYVLPFILFRVYLLLTAKNQVGVYVNQALPVKHILFSNIIVYSFTIPAQTVIPIQFAYANVKKILLFIYPFLQTNNQLDLLSQSLGLDMILSIISLCLMGSIFMIAFFKKEIKPILLIMLFLISSVIPYILIVRGSSYLESRYYYLTLVGMAILVSYIIANVLQAKKFLISVCVSLLLVSFCLWHVTYTRVELLQQVALADKRLEVLKTIKKAVPQLQKKTVIYITSDTSYVVTNNPVPFQQGVGYTLLVYLYNDNFKLLKEMLLDNYLWNMGSQGYKQIGGEGYGFFADYKDLIAAYNKYHFSPKMIYAFSWNSKDNNLEDISVKVRKQLAEPMDVPL